MEEVIQHSDVLHGITNDVFQRILELGPQLRDFVTLAKQYHKALLGASVAANSFYQGFAKIARLASDSRASNKLLGKGICDIIAVHKQIENQINNTVKSLGDDFIIPLETWIEHEISETKSCNFPRDWITVSKHRNHQVKQKTYIQDSKTALELVEKSRSDLVKVRKKSQRSKTIDKYNEKEKQLMSANEQYQTKLDELRVSGCHEVLRAERNAFSFIVEKISSVSKIAVVHHEKAFNLLNSRLPIWEKLVRQPLSLDLTPSSLVQQVTDNGNYVKSLDEHLSSKDSPLSPTISPVLPSTTHQKTLFDKRLSVQVPLGVPMLKNDPTPGKNNRVKLQAIYPHNAADSTQLTFEVDDVIKTLTDVTSGWQYGENSRTEESGWFPVAFTDKVIGVTTSAKPNHTMPINHTHHRPTVIPTENGIDCIDNMPPIPDRDYGVPLNDLKTKENNNHVSINRYNSGTKGNSLSSKEPSEDIPEVNNIDPYYPPPPPPPPLPILDEETSAPFPPPPAPPPPPFLSGNYDQ